MMTYQNNQPGLRTIYEYLMQLQTPTCFVPQHLQTNPGSVTPSYSVTHQSIRMMIANDRHPNQPMVSMCLDLSCTCTYHSVPQPSLAKVPPTQLDHPPDQSSYTMSNIQSTPCRVMSLYLHQPQTIPQYPNPEKYSICMGTNPVYSASPQSINATRRSTLRAPTQPIVTSAAPHARNHLRPP